MNSTSVPSTGFAPPHADGRSLEKAGFRFGAKGTHSSRTLMLADLEAVLSAVPGEVSSTVYARAIVDGNCLGKPTASTRRLSSQRLTELYALDPSTPIFRVLRHLWGIDDRARPLLAMLTAISRDPLFMASASPVLSQPIDAEIQRAPIRKALRELVGERMNDDTLDKVVRNISSSWTQVGHLNGRTFKFRRRVSATPTALAYALWLGRTAGFSGSELLSTGWVAALDCTSSTARALALEAKRIGLIDLRLADDIVEFGLDRLDPALGRKHFHGAN